MYDSQKYCFNYLLNIYFFSRNIIFENYNLFKETLLKLKILRIIFKMLLLQLNLSIYNRVDNKI